MAKIMDFKGFDTGNDLLTRQWLVPINLPGAIEKNLVVEMLRLDLIHPEISGNKWLKLEGWMKKYNEQKYQGILTAGGPWSNHLHACAYACMLNNIPMKAVIKGNTKSENQMIEDLRNWKVTIEYANRQTFYDQSHWQTMGEKNNCLWIPMGGDGKEGEAGVTRWMNELPLPAYDYIITPVGTATTLAGMAKSNISFNNLWGFDPGTGDKSLEVKVMELNANLPTRKVKMITLNNKFGKLTQGLIDFMDDWKLNTQIPLDFVYTAPMCKAFLQMLEQNIFPNESRILMVHTGGLQGNRSHPLLLSGNRGETGNTNEK